MSHLAADRRLSGLEFVAWVAIVFVILFVFFVGGTYPWMGSPLVRAGTQLLLGALILGWLVVWLRRTWWRPDAEGLAFVLPGVAAGLLSVIGATSPRLALEAVYWALLLGCSFLVLTRLAAHPGFRIRVRGLIVLLFLIVLFGYGAQLIVTWADWYRVVGRVTALPLHPGGASLTFGASPVVAIVLLTLGPPAGAILMSAKHGRLAVGVLVVLTAIAVLATGSRSSYLAAGVEALVILAVLGRSGIATSLRALPRWALGAGILVGSGIAVALVGALAARLLDSSTLSERWDIWRSAMTVWERSPWLGAGAGTWPFLRAAAYPAGSPSLVVPHAHNPAIQLLAETGMVGVVLVAIGVIALVHGIVRRARQGHGETRIVAVATLISLTGFAAVSLLDDFVNLPAVLLALALPAAWVLGHPLTTPTTVRPWVARLAASGSLVALISIGWAAWQMNAAALTADLGVRAANAGDWSTAQRRFSEAVAIDPGMPLYRLESATALAMLGDSEAAWSQLEVVGEADGAPVVLVSRAWLALDRGDTQAARETVERAYERAAGDASALINIGTLADRLGLPALATSAFADALIVAPSLAASRELQDAALFGAFVARAIESAPERSRDPYAAPLIRAFAGSAEEVLGELRTEQPSAARDRALAITLEILGQYDEALAVLTKRLDDEPVDGSTADLLATLSLAAGDQVAAARYERWAQLVGVGSAAVGLVSGSTVATVREAGTSNLATNYPWVIYWRFGPAVLSPPDAMAIMSR